MPEEKKIIDKKEPGSCVVHDDTFDWGGADDAVNRWNEKVKEKKIGEPMNWPVNRYRS